MKDGDNYVFVLPADKTVRVNRLAPLPIVRHKPCKLSFNPYLDNDYHIYLKHRRDVQKATGAIVLFGQDKADDALIAVRGCWPIKT